MSGVATVTLEVAGNTLMLLPERAVFLPESDTLLVADAHIGKATSFRQLGVPVPAGTTQETLSVLTGLIQRLDARRLVFLGDFLHSARSLAPDTLATLQRWRELHAGIELTLVRGNHDQHAGDPPARLDIQPVDEPLALRGLALAHHPRPMAGAFVLAGHLHPCVSVGGRAHDWHRLPCFWFSDTVGVLPAFGAFTGMQAIRARPGERVFAAAPDRVFELQHRPRRFAVGQR
jgi:DNA ligase-associated metallophosphoesterase